MHHLNKVGAVRVGLGCQAQLSTQPIWHEEWCELHRCTPYCAAGAQENKLNKIGTTLINLNRITYLEVSDKLKKNEKT